MLLGAAALWFYIRLKQAGVPLADSATVLSQRNDVLESVLEGLGDCCLLVNEKKEIVFANHETNDLFRVGGQLNGKPLAELIHDVGLDDPVVVAGRQETSRDGRVRQDNPPTRRDRGATAT